MQWYVINNSDGSGWATRARRGVQFLNRNFKASHSLRLLKYHMQNLANSLVSPTRRNFYSIFGVSGTDRFFSNIGLPGSRLQANLQAILDKIDPYDARYIADEISHHHEFHKRLTMGDDFYRVRTSASFLSEEGLATVRDIIKAPALLQRFKREFPSGRFSADVVIHDVAYQPTQRLS